MQELASDLTVAQVACALGLSRGVVNRMLESGEMVGAQPEGSTVWRVSPAALAAYKEAQRATYMRFVADVRRD